MDRIRGGIDSGHIEVGEPSGCVKVTLALLGLSLLVLCAGVGLVTLAAWAIVKM